MRTSTDFRRYRLVAATVLFALPFAGACSDSTAPADVSRTDLLRAFEAVTLTATTGGVPFDVLAIGGSLSIALHANGTTTGRLFVPGGGEDGGHLDADLDGEFVFNDETDEVSFAHEADTFLRDITLTAKIVDGVVQLEGQRAFGATTLRLVLR